jgi:ABC-2 type transport system permease protein
MISRVWLVAQREMRSQLSGKALKISFIIMVVLALAGTWAAGAFLGGDDDGGEAESDRIKVAVVGQLPEGAVAAELEQVPADTPEQAADLVREGTVEAAVVVQDGATTVVGLTDVPQQVVDALTVMPEVSLLSPPRVPQALVIVSATVSGVLFMMLVVMFGQVAANNTVVEKQTRVVEILLTAVPAKVLMAGKVLGNAILALSQVAGLLLAAALGVVLGGQTDMLKLLSASMIWFLVLFVFGFVLYSSLLAGCAALVSRMEDVGSAIQPVIWLLMIPYMLQVAAPSAQSLQTWMSFIPLSSPMAMPARLMTGQAAWWEPLVALVILAVTTYGAILLGGKLYSSSLLRMGGRVKLKEALLNKA